MKNEREVIERLLSHASHNSAEAVDALLKKYKNIAQIFNTGVYSLEDTLSGDMSTSLYIKLVSALLARKNTDKFKFQRKHTDVEIQNYLISLFFGASVEIAYMISIDDCGKTLALDKINEGTINSSSIMPRKIIDIARARGAKSVIVAHNHPDGFATPSKDDIESTRFLESVLHSASLNLLAHYVVAGADVVPVDIGK